jgi:hypothetical protein
MFPSPTVNDAGNCAFPPSQIERDTLVGAVIGKYIASQKQRDLTAIAADSGGQLNPDWVEWLMGWPVGWTSLDPLPRDRFDDWLDKTQAGVWWDDDPSLDGRVPRVAAGIENRIHRLEATGNGQVPATALTAWNVLLTRQYGE